MKAMKRTLLTAIVMAMISGIGIQAQEKTDVKEETVFKVVEDMPQFQGGDIKQFGIWVSKQVKYPKIALKNGISGKVYCSFVIDKSGKVGDVKIKRGVDPSLDNEVLRVVKSSPAWTPGMQRGKKVSVSMAVPVAFKLDSPAPKEKVKKS